MKRIAVKERYQAELKSAEIHQAELLAEIRSCEYDGKPSEKEKMCIDKESFKVRLI